MAGNTTILWFRQDLRLADNPALAEAVSRGPTLPLFILDDENSGDWRLGGASRWWLHRSLQALDRSLGGRLHVLRGNPLELLPKLAAEQQASAVFWNRCYEPWRMQRDTRLKEALRKTNIHSSSCNGSLLWEPWTVAKQDGTPYKVFTPYYTKGCLQALPPPEPEPAPKTLDLVACPQPADKIDRLGLLPAIPWYREMEDLWTPGENGAREQLADFIDAGLPRYRLGRDFPALEAVSRLSPHLHWGELSPRQAWYQVQQQGLTMGLEGQVEHFQRELGWREFSHYLLYHFPGLPRNNFQPRFDAFPWAADEAALHAWQRGKTGYPIIDAGMRELWRTGYMHNRVRMIVASFLVKNLQIHWHRGAEWFWDCLLDADLANNSASWQWVAGSGADAAPYFRIFNPVTQGMKFDPEGIYVRRYVPELAGLPNRYIHDPAGAPAQSLADAGIVLGKDYPLPLVDLRESRELALGAFRSLPR